MVTGMPDSRVGRNGQGQWTSGTSGNAGGNPRRAGYVEALRKRGKNGENFEELAEFFWAVVRCDVEALKPLLPAHMTENVDALTLAVSVPKIPERIMAAKEIREIGIGKALEVAEDPQTLAGSSEADLLSQVIDAMPPDVVARVIASKKLPKVGEAH